MAYSGQDEIKLGLLQEQLKQLLAERRDNLNGNMAFSFGYDPAVAAIEQQISVVQARINSILDGITSQSEGSKNSHKVVIYDEECEEYTHFEVGDVVSSNSGNYYTVNREAALGPVLEKCQVGQTISLGLVVSVNDCPLLSKHEHEAAKLKYEEEAQRLVKWAAEKRAEQLILAEELEQQQRKKLHAENEAKAKLQQEAKKRLHLEQEQRQQEERKRQQELERQLSEARNAPCIALSEAESRLQEIGTRYQTGSADKSATINELSVLQIRCQKSLAAASSHQRDSSGTGAIIGGLIGFIGGPIGAMIGAGIGAALGSTDQEASEKDSWSRPMRDIEAFLKKLSSRGANVT